MTEATITPIDPIAALERQADAEIEAEINKGDLSKIKESKRRLANARLILQTLELQHKALLEDLRERRAVA